MSKFIHFHHEYAEPHINLSSVSGEHYILVRKKGRDHLLTTYLAKGRQPTECENKTTILSTRAYARQVIYPTWFVHTVLACS